MRGRLAIKKKVNSNMKNMREGIKTKNKLRGPMDYVKRGSCVPV